MIAIIKMQLFAILAATICGSMGLFFSRPWNKELRVSSQSNYYGHTAFAFAVGYMFAFWYIMGKIPSWPVDEAYHSLFYLAGVVAIVAFAASFFSSFYVRIIAILILSCLAAMYTIPEWLFEDDDGNLMMVIWYWRGGYVVAATTLFVLMERLEKLPGVTHSLVWFVTATSASILALFAASAKIAQLCGAISAMSMAIAVVCFLLPHISLSRGALYFLGIFLPSLLVNCYLLREREISFYLCVLIGFCPLSVYLLEIRKLNRKLTPIKLTIAQVGIVSIISGVVLAIGYLNQ